MGPEESWGTGGGGENPLNPLGGTRGKNNIRFSWAPISLCKIIYVAFSEYMYKGCPPLGTKVVLLLQMALIGHDHGLPAAAG